MSFFQRIQDVFGVGDQYEEADYEEAVYVEDQADYPYQAAYAEGQGMPRRRAASPQSPQTNVVGMPRLASGQPEVLLMEPRSFEEIPQAVQALRDRKSVILNLGLMDPDQAQRAADYVAGGAYALDGHQERLGAHIFLFTPSFVQISSYSPNPTGFQPSTPAVSVHPPVVTPPSPWSNDPRSGDPPASFKF